MGRQATDEMADEALLADAGRGDRDAFAVLIERHERTIVQYLYRYLGRSDRGACEDLAQDTFLKAWKAAATFVPKARVRTWLLQIATNTALNYRRGQRLRRMLGMEHAPEPRSTAASPSDDDGQMDDDVLERESAIRQAVDRLPNLQRSAVLLRHFHEMSYADIAQVLETTVPAVESLLFRARKRLAKGLATMAPHQDRPQVSAGERALSGE